MSNYGKILVAAAGLAIGLCAWAQEKKESPAGQTAECTTTPDPEKYAQIVKAYQDAAALGSRHADLARYLGDWDIVFRYKIPGMSTETKGKATFRWLIEGRWLIEEVDGEFNGHPFKGFNLIGYDNLKKQYVTCWVDSMSTSFVVAGGAMNSGNTVLTTYTQVDDLARGMREKTSQSTTRFVDENTMVYTINDVLWGEPQPMMEATYTRKR